MTERATEQGWFEGIDRGDDAAVRSAIETRSVGSPADWPVAAVEAGFADDEDDYYAALHEATVHAAQEMARERERSADQQLIHGVRTMDELAETTNELAERFAEWAGSAFDEADTGVAYAREVADRDPDGPAEERIVALAERIADLEAEREALRTFVETETPSVAPNLAAMAGPVLGARLIALAGGLESLARMPSGTVQVLGAEDALFAHLQGRATSPKHGVIYTHEYVRGTRPEERGSAARALAGKLTIAARVDHYSGERKPEVDAELDERIERIRSRGSQ